MKTKQNGQLHGAANGVTLASNGSASLAPLPSMAVFPASIEEMEGEGVARAASSKPHNEQRIDLQYLIALAISMLAGVEGGNPNLHLLLEANGVTAEYIATIRAQIASLQEAILARREAMANVAVHHGRVAAAIAHARSDYTALREVARTLVQSPEGRIALGLNGRIPNKTESFYLLACETLTMARKEPYASLLASATLGSERLAASVEAMNAVEAVWLARQNAQEQAVQTTRVRDEAARELRRMVQQLKAEARLVLRQHPEILPPAWL